MALDWGSNDVVTGWYDDMVMEWADNDDDGESLVYMA